RPRPCRRRRPPVDGRCRSPGAWPGRRRSTVRSARPPGSAGRRRWSPRRWRSRRTGGWSRAGRRTSWRAGRAGTGRYREPCPGTPGPARRPRSRAASRRSPRACATRDRRRRRPFAPWQPLTPEVIAALPESPAVFEVANLVRTVLFIDRAQGKLRERLTTLWQDPTRLPVRPGGHYFRYELSAREEETLQKRLAAYRKRHRGALPVINHEAEQRPTGTVTPIRR